MMERQGMHAEFVGGGLLESVHLEDREVTGKYY
jgi:hypothetical protein